MENTLEKQNKPGLSLSELNYMEEMMGRIEKMAGRLSKNTRLAIIKANHLLHLESIDLYLSDSINAINTKVGKKLA